MNFTGQLPNSNVLVKLRILNDKIAGGLLWIDRVFNEMEHTDIVGDVIAVPTQATYKDITGKIFEVPIEIQAGDVVYMHYMAVQQALKQYRGNAVVYNPKGRIIRDNGETYVLLNYYNNFFMAIRDGSPVMVNDYVLVESTNKELTRLQEKAKSDGLLLPDQIVNYNKENTQWGIVRYIGKNLSPEENTWGGRDVKVGDEVFMVKNADIPLEYELHQTFMPGKKLFRVKRRDILFISEK